MKQESELGLLIFGLRFESRMPSDYTFASNTRTLLCP